ncbi:hypothetical protein Tco_1177218 [Tanacetum coccineum]
MDDSKSSREWSAHESGSKLCMGLVKYYGWLLDVVKGCLVVAHSCFPCIHKNSDLMVVVVQTVGVEVVQTDTLDVVAQPITVFQSGRVYEKPAYKRENRVSSFTASATQALKLSLCTANWNPPTYKDSYEKRLIQVVKIHTDHNVADLLTKAFDVSHKTVTKEWEDKMKRAATTASSLEAKQDSGNINRTQSMTTLNEPLPQGTGSGSGPRYALTVNPTIYASCIKQFWATAKVKTVNDIVQIQALVDKKKVIVTETSVRSDLQLEDAEEPHQEELDEGSDIPTDPQNTPTITQPISAPSPFKP